MLTLPEPLPRNEKQTTEPQAFKMCIAGCRWKLISCCIHTFFFSFFKGVGFLIDPFYLFIWLVAQGLSCGMWDLVSWPGIEPRPPALGAQSLSRWATPEVPNYFFLWGGSCKLGLLREKVALEHPLVVPCSNCSLLSGWAWVENKSA